MANKKISELDQTLNLSDQADFPLSQDNGGEPTTFRAKLTQIATKIAEAITFSNLKTGNKQLVSAVNQTISNLADDFNTTAGSTYSKDDCVLYNGVLYQCINNSGTTSGTFIDADWTAIKAVDVGSGGGGGGTTDYEDLSNKPQVNSVELVGNKSLDDLGIMPASLSKTVSDAIAHITDGADNIPVKSLVSQIIAVQSGSGEKSPDNPYTISGFDSGIITVTDNDQITNTYTFAFGQTVYGGHFDNKGNLVITHMFGELVAKSKNGNYFRATLSDLGLPNIYDRNADLLCDRYAVADVTTTTSNNNQITVYGDMGDAYAIRWVDLNYINADVATYNAAMENNKPQIVYKLANPITLSITSQNIPTLLGENNIFSNCGDVEVTYYTDNADEIAEVAKATASTPLLNYSTDEQVIGTWIDGKPLYERVIDLGADTNISYDSWTLTTVSLSEIDRLVLIQGLNSTGAAYYGDLYGGNNNGYLQLLTGRNGTYVSVRYLIFRYTKSST